MTVSPSATSTGKGGASSPGASPRPGGAAGVRQRKSTAGSRSTAKSGASMPGGGAGNAGMWRFYTEDSPGLKV